VEGESNEPTSLLNLYRRLITTRRRHPALSIGGYRPILASGDVLLFMRTHPNSSSVLVALNLGDQAAAAVLEGETLSGRVLVSAFADREGEAIEQEIDLRPNEGLLIEIATRQG
jgi:alpha-glucosidase